MFRPSFWQLEAYAWLSTCVLHVSPRIVQEVSTICGNSVNSVNEVGGETLNAHQENAWSVAGRSCGS